MNQRIKALVPGQTVFDEVVRGLHARAHKTKKSYYLYYRTKSGIERRPKIGDVDQISIQEARKRARILLSKVSVGEDPKGQWDEQKLEMTVSELFNQVSKDYWEKPRFLESGWAKEVKRLFKRNIEPSFGEKKLSDVTATLVRAWHKGFEAKPYAGNRSLEVLSKLFSFAEETGLWSGANPCILVKGFKEQKRSRYASPEELKDIRALLEREKEREPRAVAFIYLLLLTGSRPRALEKARRDDIERVSYSGELFGALKFRGKSSADSGEPETLIIPPEGLKLIDSIPEPLDGTLFGIKMPRALWNKIRKEANCPDLWARDLRRTFATVALSEGADIGVVGELLNHRSAQTTKIYAKLTTHARIKAVRDVSESLKRP